MTLKLSLRTTSEPISSSRWSISGCSDDLHLAPARQNVDGAVLVLADDDAVRRRRLGELVDLLAQRGDVIASLAQGVGQLLVAGDRLGQLALGLEQALLERAHPLGCFGQTRPEVLDLGDERLDLFLWFLCHGSSSLLSGPTRPTASEHTHASRCHSRHVAIVTEHDTLRRRDIRRFSDGRRGSVHGTSKAGHGLVPIGRKSCFHVIGRVISTQRRALGARIDETESTTT